MQPEITIPSEAKALMQDAEKTLQLVRDSFEACQKLVK